VEGVACQRPYWEDLDGGMVSPKEVREGKQGQEHPCALAVPSLQGGEVRSYKARVGPDVGPVWERLEGRLPGEATGHAATSSGWLSARLALIAADGPLGVRSTEWREDCRMPDTGLGSKGGLKGGKARVAVLTPEERSAREARGGREGRKEARRQEAEAVC
jgi:hypothetical protein